MNKTQELIFWIVLIAIVSILLVATTRSKKIQYITPNISQTSDVVPFYPSNGKE